jgi:hypothetical protein
MQTLDMEEHVLSHADVDASVSMKQVGEKLNVSHMTFWRVPHEQLLCLYPLQWFLCLLIFEHLRTLVCSVKHLFASSVLFTDEVCFGTDVINICKQYQWAEEKFHGIIQSRYQQKLIFMIARPI